MTAFIFDLNHISFASSNLNALFYLAVITAMTELIWLCGAQKKPILLGAGLIIFVPVFIYIYTAVLPAAPFPCHENKNVTIGEYVCGTEHYVLKKSPNLDLFEPGHAYTLYRSIKRYPVQKKIDRYVTPKGYYDSYINPKHQCLPDGVKVDLYVDDDYVLWSIGVGKR
ncbi:MAG: hypothetical protein LBB56_05375 [Chitinispirillales bacterium]|nr:hypothetical protein [Chitinispirillales bacterium]